jgi:Dockerin type I domain
MLANRDPYGRVSIGTNQSLKIAELETRRPVASGVIAIRRGLAHCLRVGVLTLATGLGLAATATTSDAQVFVADTDNLGINAIGPRIGEYTFTGATVNTQLVGGYASGMNAPWALAEADNQLFVTNYEAGTVGVYTTTGVTVNSALISGINGPESIAVGGGNVYVINQFGTVAEYTTSGDLVNSALLQFASHEDIGLAFSGGNLFVSDLALGTVGQYTPSGDTENAALVTGISGYAIAVADGKIYVANSPTSIGEYTTAGATVNASLITGVSIPTAIGLSGDKIYVMNINEANSRSYVGEYTTAGATINASLISGFNTSFGMAVAAPLAGDVNYDGIVNGQDFAQIASHWLQTGPNTSDANFDSIVNGQDMALVAGNWLQTSGGGGGGGGSAVPEPTSCALAVAGAIAALFRVRRYRLAGSPDRAF